MTKSLKISVFAAILTVSAIATWSCSKEKIFKDVVAYVRTDIMLNPVSVQLVDANEANGAVNLTNMKFTVIGPDADKIYTVVGEKKIKADGNFVHLGVTRFNAPKQGEALQFGLKITSPDYAESISWYSVTDAETNVLRVLPLVKLDAPPAGVSVFQKNFPVDGSNGTAQDILLETPVSPGSPQYLKVKIPAGTQMFAPGSTTPLDGSVRATVVFYDPNAVFAFPTGSTTNGVLDSNGKPKKPGSTAASGFTNLIVNVGPNTVSTFSNAVEVTMSVDDSFENPTTGTPVQAGDSVTVWSLNEDKMAWKHESRTSVGTVGADLTMTWNLTHLSWWSCGWFPETSGFEPYKDANGNWVPATTPVLLNVASTVQADTDCGTGGGWFFTKIFNNTTGTEMYAGFQEYYNGRSIDVSKYIAEIPADGFIWKIYKGSVCGQGTQLFESQPITSSGTLNLNNALPTDALKVSILASGTCGVGDIVIPTGMLFFRESGSGCFRPFGTMNLGVGCTSGIYKGQKYDFGFFYGGLAREVDAITIPTEDQTLILNYPNSTYSDTLRLIFTGANQDELNFDFRGVKIPDQLCDEFKKFF